MPHCDLDLEDTKTIFPHDSPTYENIPLYQVWSHKVEQFKKYHPDKIWTDTHSDSNTDRQTATVIPIYSPNFVRGLGGGGGGGYNNVNSNENFCSILPIKKFNNPRHLQSETKQ